MDTSEFNTIQPHNIEAEQCILGSILYDSSILPTVIESIKAEYFYSEQHKSIYNIILRMFSTNTPVDVVTVNNEIEKLNIFESSAEGRRYLASISEVPTTKNISSYCKIVTDRYHIRTLANVAYSILDDIKTGENDAQLLIDSAEQRIYDIRQGKNIQGLVHISEVVSSAYDRLGKIAGPDKEKYIGARSGFTGLDALISGLNNSDLIILAARPGMGKTSFAMNIASYVAGHSGKEVAVFNLEMSGEQVAMRLLSTESKVESMSMRNGRIAGEDWAKIAVGAGYLSTLPLLIDDTAPLTAQQMKAKLRRTKNLGLVVIDYLQLMDSTSKSTNKAIEVAEITRQLKLMAKELDVPVILLSQLSRGVESRTDKRPMLSDLRDSGAIEQDADIVLFLYRESYYDKESEKKNISECIVAKNRHGETGIVELYWDGRFTRFSNLDKTPETS